MVVKAQHCVAFYDKNRFLINAAAQGCPKLRSYLTTNLDESSFEDTKIEVRTYARLRIVECRSSMRTFTVI